MRRANQRILAVDDHAEMVSLLADQLRDAGYEVVTATDGATALALAADQQPDVVISDLRMAKMDGFDVLDGLRRLDPEMPVVIMTAFGAVDTAVEAMKRGAFHYLTKPFRLDELLVLMQKAMETRVLLDENRALRRVSPSGPGGLLGTGAAMRQVQERIVRLAAADVPVLIRGESGTGKERVARALHDQSPRRDAPFVAVNCASLPAQLMESELFGHVKGSFTGATGARRGLFLEADGGTLFLDEIGDLPLDLQPHLLRVLQDGVIRPVGSDTPRRVNARIVAATHQPLEDRVKDGRFRRDLLYRLDVVPIDLPPLRARRDDIRPLTDTFLERVRASRGARRLTPDAIALLLDYPWPGNVRELEHLVERITLLLDGPDVDVSGLLSVAPQLRGAPVARGPWREVVPLREMQAEYVAWAVQQCDGNKTRAAELLGIDVSTIHRRERAAAG